MAWPIPVSDELVVSVGLTPSPLMSMFTDVANVSAIGRINKHSFLLAAAGHLCVNFEIWGAGSGLSKHKRHRDDCLFSRHRYPIQGCWVCQNGFDERGALVLTHGRVSSVRDIEHTSAIEMSVYLSDTGTGIILHLRRGPPPTGPGAAGQRVALEALYYIIFDCSICVCVYIYIYVS